MPPSDNPPITSSSARATWAAGLLGARPVLGGGHLRRPDHLDLPVLPLGRVHGLVADAVHLLARDLHTEAEGQRAVEGLVPEAAQRRHHLGPIERAGLL